MVILIGNVAQKPVVKKSHTGQDMVCFILATNRTWYDPQGNKQSQAEFHNVVAWGKISEICKKFLKKSTLVYIQGYLKTRSWENESGERHYKTEVIIQDILVLDRGIQKKDLIDKQDASLIMDNPKSATDITQSFKDKLSQGNNTKADTNISDSEIFGSDYVSLDEPLFQEES